MKEKTGFPIYNQDETFILQQNQTLEHFHNYICTGGVRLKAQQSICQQVDQSSERVTHCECRRNYSRATS